MATRTWSSSGSSDMNNATNYSGEGALLATDDLLFNGTSVIAATATATLAVKSITTVAAYTGAFSTGGQAFNIGGSVNFDNVSALTINSTITITTDGDFHIGAGITAFTGGGSIDLQGTGGLDIDEATFSSPLSNIKLAYSEKTTTFTATGSNGLMNGQLTINGGTFTINGTFNIYTKNANPIVIVGTPTINGNGAIYLQDDYGGASSATVNIPAITMGGTVAFYFIQSFNQATTINQNGDVIIGGDWHFRKNSAGNFVYNTNNYALSFANALIGNQSGANSATYNWGSSIITCTSRNSYVSTENMGTSQWTCNGSWVYAASSVIDAGSSQITLTETINLTSNSCTFYDLIFNGAGKTLTLADALNCNSLTVTNGIFNQNGKIIISAGNVRFQGTGNLTLNTTLTITGNATFQISTSGTKTTTSLALVAQGTTILNVGTITITSFAPTANKTYTFDSGETLTISNYTASQWNGSNASNLVTFQASSSGVRANIVNPADMTVLFMAIKDISVSNLINAMKTNGNVNNGNNVNWKFSNRTPTTQNLLLLLTPENGHKTS